MSKPRYETYTRPDGTKGLQRTLDMDDADDRGFLSDGIRLVDDKGRERKLTPEEAEALGIRRIVGTANPVMMVKVR